MTDPKSTEELQAELEATRRRQAELEQELAAAKRAGDGGVAADQVAGDVFTGDGATKIEAQTYIEKNYGGPLPDEAAPTARRRYLTRLLRRCNVLQLAALGADDEADVTLNDVYIALDTRTRAPAGGGSEKKSRAQLAHLERGDQEQERVLSALEVATRSRRLLLLGDPGSGKSTFVRQLADRHARALLADQPEPPSGWNEPLVPLIITLHELTQEMGRLEMANPTSRAGAKRLVEIFDAHWRGQLAEARAQEYRDELGDELEKGKVLLIFDGLDEVAAARRVLVRALVHAINRAYPDVEQIIVTCRVRSYHEGLLPQFDVHRLADFDEEKIKRFIGAWYQTQVRLEQVKSGEVQKKIADLEAAALSQDLRELAANPMLLTTMTVIHQQEVGLPRQRVRLFNLAVQILLYRWQRRRSIPLSPALDALLRDELRLRFTLERIAYDAHQQQADSRTQFPAEEEANDTQGVLTRGELLTLLETREHLGTIELASEFLDYVDQRAGLLIGRGGSAEADAAHGAQPVRYSFPHRTFQEYLAGCHMMRSRRYVQEYRKRAQEEEYWWLAAQLGAEELYYVSKEVNGTLDLAYGLCPHDEPASPTHWRWLLWSGQIARLVGRGAIVRDGDPLENPEGGQAYLERLLPRLAGLLEENALGAIELVEAGRVLGHLGDSRASVLSVDAMEFCWVPPGPFTMGAKEDEPEFLGDDRPAFEYNLARPYAIGRYPVSNGQYAEFVEAGGYRNEDWWPEAKAADLWREGRVTRRVYRDGEWIPEEAETPHDFGEPFHCANYPVVGISWYEALAFCRWLTHKLRGEGLLPAGWTVALPSEPQWEKAARGGHLVPDAPRCFGVTQLASHVEADPQSVSLLPNPRAQRTYPWGDEIDADRLNYLQTEVGTSNALGAFARGESPYGAREMCGGVWEWTISLWGKDFAKAEFGYPYEPADGREDLAAPAEVLRVLRGGSFAYTYDCVRCAARGGDFPNDRGGNVGFRCVVSPICSEF